MMRSSDRSTRRRLPAVLAVLAAGAVAATSALYTDTEVASDNTLRSGVLDLSVDRQSTATTATGMAPGDSVYEYVTVTNSGDIALTYNTVVSLSDGDGLEEELNVSTVAGAPTRDGEGAAAGTQVQSINGFTSLDDTSTSAPGQDRPLAPGDSEELLLVVQLDRDAQLGLSGKTATVVWTFTGTMNVAQAEPDGGVVDTPPAPTQAARMTVVDADTIRFAWDPYPGAAGYTVGYSGYDGVDWFEESVTEPSITIRLSDHDIEGITYLSYRIDMNDTVSSPYGTQYAGYSPLAPPQLSYQRNMWQVVVTWYNADGNTPYEVRWEGDGGWVEEEYTPTFMSGMGTYRFESVFWMEQDVTQFQVRQIALGGARTAWSTVTIDYDGPTSGTS